MRKKNAKKKLMDNANKFMNAVMDAEDFLRKLSAYLALTSNVLRKLPKKLMEPTSLIFALFVTFLDLETSQVFS